MLVLAFRTCQTEHWHTYIWEFKYAVRIYRLTPFIVLVKATVGICDSPVCTLLLSRVMNACANLENQPTEDWHL